MASMIYVLAAGKNIDTQKSKTFSEIVDEIYANPFTRKGKEMTAEEIKAYIVSRLEE